MINKQSVWFVTLFSLILVLSVYYVTMPSELLIGTTEKEETQTVSTDESSSESAELVALRVEAEEQMLDEITELKKVLTSSESTTKEKNEAFEKMQDLNKNKGVEETIENKIKKEFSLSSFVNIDGNNISVTVDSSKHDKALANKIMRSIQEEFSEPMTISVKFQK